MQETKAREDFFPSGTVCMEQNPSHSCSFSIYCSVKAVVKLGLKTWAPSQPALTQEWLWRFESHFSSATAFLCKPQPQEVMDSSLKDIQKFYFQLICILRDANQQTVLKKSLSLNKCNWGLLVLLSPVICFGISCYRILLQLSRVLNSGVYCLGKK